MMKKIEIDDSPAAVRAREKCRRCAYFKSLDNLCRLRREKMNHRRRKTGCYRFQSDLWGGVA